jgi:hypothetical protein
MNSGQAGANARFVCPRTRRQSIHEEVPGRRIAFWYDRAKWHLPCQESSYRRRWPNLYRYVVISPHSFSCDLDAFVGARVMCLLLCRSAVGTRNKWFALAPKGKLTQSYTIGPRPKLNGEDRPRSCFDLYAGSYKTQIGSTSGGDHMSNSVSEGVGVRALL